jgi:PhnB protein
MLQEKTKPTAAKSAAAIPTVVQPYLFFNGRCEEAVAFYKKALGAEIEMLMRFKDNPDMQGSGGSNAEMCQGAGQINPEWVMHTSFKIGESQIMASDGMPLPPEKAVPQGFSLSITAKNAVDCDRIFNALAQGGQVQMPLGKTFFAERFGAVADKFGVSWMVIVPPAQQ